MIRIQSLILPLSCIRTLWFLLYVVVLTGCTTSAWVVEENPVPDPESESIGSERFFFLEASVPDARNPVLELELVNERVLNYNRHLVSKRYIQDYRPRYGYLALGLGAAGLGLYFANSTSIEAEQLSARERALLNLTAVGIGAASWMAMKPKGEPRAAGEQRLLQKTDILTLKDTITVTVPARSEALLTIMRDQDTLVTKRPLSFKGNALSVHIGQETGIRERDGTDTDGLMIHVQHQDVLYEKYFPIGSFMQRLVEVTSSSVPLRTSPANLGNNIVRHVNAGSKYPYLSDVDERWYRILKTGGPAYIRKDQSRLIWHMADTVGIENLVIQPDQPVFGDLEIERNLPAHPRINSEGIAIIIINADYSEPVSYLPHGNRTGELAEHYFQQVLGYYSDNIRVFENMNSQEMQQLISGSDSLFIGGRYLSLGESDLLFYYYGHALSHSEDDFFLVPVDYDPAEPDVKLISLDTLIEKVAAIRSRQTFVILDTDWTGNTVFGHISESGIRANQAARNRLEGIFSRHQGSNTAFMWAAQPGQQSLPYRHSSNNQERPYDIFTWYFFKALQDGATNSGEIDNYLQRYIPYTSRRLHDRAQDHGFSGNRELRLLIE